MYSKKEKNTLDIKNVSIRRQEHEVSITNCSLKGKKWVPNVESFVKDLCCFDFFFFLIKKSGQLCQPQEVFAATGFSIFSSTY